MTQMNVETKVIFNGPASERQTGKQRIDDDNVWATEAHEAVRGVLVARTLLPNRACKVPVQLFNVTDRPVAVRGATVLGNLERLHTLSFLCQLHSRRRKHLPTPRNESWTK